MFYQRMGDPSKPEGKALLVERSPLTSAAKIKTPLMIAQGANDPRVNHAESEQIVVALRDRGFPVEYLLIPDEGHGFARPVNNMAALMATERFFAKFLGGRYQQGGTPEVTARLREITVDPKTVVLAKKVDAGAVGLPKLAMDPKPVTNKYKEKLVVQRQEIAINLLQSIKSSDDGGWVVTDLVDTAMGQISDTAVLDKGTLALRKRSVQQGPVSIEINFNGNKATGTANIGGQDKPIAVDLGGPVFADTGSALSIACLPLAEGYSTTYRNFDLRKQKEKLLQLKVVGSETVTVAAGTFDTFKIEITSADGGSDHETYWIAKDSRKAVKLAAVVADMGGATLTGELVP
jgi:hypothetical protein